MALIEYIDAINRRIYLSIDSIGASIHPMDIYTEVRNLRATDETLRPFDMFLKAYGNVSKGGGKSTERYVQTISGTKLVPYDVSQELTIIGTIITDDGYEGVYCFDRSLLSASTVVDINYVPPQVEVITITSGSSLTVEQDATLSMTKYQNKAVHIDTELIINGDGSALSPFNNVAGTADFVGVNGINIVYIYGEVTVDRDIKNFTIIGIGTPIVHCNNQDFKNTEFTGVELRGVYTGEIKAKKCVLGDNLELNGDFDSCSIVNNITCMNGGMVTLANCFSSIANNGKSNLSLNTIGSSQAILSNFKGHLTLSDVNTPADEVNISMPNNNLVITASCTDGSINLAGHMVVDNNSGINCTVTDVAVITPATASDLVVTKYM